MEFDESDQAGLCGSLFALHLETHGGTADENCSFCKNFIIPPPNLTGKPLESYGFMVFDMNSDEPPKIYKYERKE